MATKTSKGTEQQPYYGEQAKEAAETQQSHLFTLGDEDKIALETLRTLTEVMNAAGRMQETAVFDALADMRTDLLVVQQSLSMSPDELTDEVATARARLDAQAIPSLEAMQQAMVQRLDQGNVPEGVDAKAERKAVEEAFDRVREGFGQLMPKVPVLEEQQQPQAPSQQALDMRQVGEGLQGRFAQLREALSGDPQQQPSDEQVQTMIDQTQAQMQQEGWTPAQGHARAEQQRRQAAAARQQEGKGVPVR